MTKIISIPKLSNSLSIGACLALLLAFSLSFAFSRAQAAELNIVADNNLMVGSTGQGVVVLQGLLSEMGYLQVPVGIPFGYFGLMTQAAVSRYQTSRGVTSESGYFGPFTKIAMRQHFAAANWLALLGW
jgi:peptidoglycan hydrolase-like protein with peptidoglycan-binding domain